MTSAPRARVCATCRESRTTGNAKMVEAGFVNCTHLKPWEWVGGHQACRFEPVRWVSKQGAG